MAPNTRYEEGESRLHIREIRVADDLKIGEIIRQVLIEYGANKPGFAWQDPELDTMTHAYQGRDRCYLVLEHNSQLMGGGGIGPFTCHLPHTCELQKMYLLPQARGRGYGQKLIDRLFDAAIERRYAHCYLESTSSMVEALSLYQKMGFKALEEPLGSSGHNACDHWLLRSL
jgi:putative acetyltransferase